MVGGGAVRAPAGQGGHACVCMSGHILVAVCRKLQLFPCKIGCRATAGIGHQSNHSGHCSRRRLRNKCHLQLGECIQKKHMLPAKALASGSASHIIMIMCCKALIWSSPAGDVAAAT